MVQGVWQQRRHRKLRLDSVLATLNHASDEVGAFIRQRSAEGLVGHDMTRYDATRPRPDSIRTDPKQHNTNTI